MEAIVEEMQPRCASEIAFDRIVAACLEMEWQILPRAAQRGVKAV